jgi:hypothetical protein
MDFEAFDRFAEGAGPAAAKILVGMRESYSVDFANLLATEVPMSLDENFDPTDVTESIESTSGDSGLPAHYSGILDALYVFRDQAKIKIDDLKTHPRPYDPSDPDKALQGKMYSLFCFKHFPWVMEVNFRLVFVRYRNLIREVTYTREQLPALIETVKAARARQLMIHKDYEESRPIEAMSGSHCFGGETRFITERGIRTLRDACGETVKILNRHGEWEDAEVHSFGVQTLLRVTLDDGSVVRATPEHRWWKLRKDRYTEGWVQTDERVTTRELERVPIVRHAHFAEPDENGIRHGFVYGDGYKRAGRPSCIALVTPPKDEHMLHYFPGARLDRGRYRKGGLPEHFKTLNGINSPSYARGFLAGLIAADGCVCKNGGVHLDCEGRAKAYAIAEIVRFGGGVVSSIRLSDGKPTKFSPKGATSRELMRMEIKPSTAPLLAPKHRERIKTKSQMRRMYREVVSIEEDATEEVFCAVVPGSESFTLANGIATSNCVYCPLLSNRECPIAEFNAQMQLTPEDRLRFNLWYQAFSAVNNKSLKEFVQGTGRNVVLKDYNGKAYVYGPVEKESSTYPLFRKTENGIATDPQGNPVMPIVGLLMDYAHATPDDTSWMGSVLISSTSLNKYLGTKKRAMLDQAVTDTADRVTKATLKVSKPLDSVPDEEPEEEGGGWEDDEEF